MARLGVAVHPRVCGELTRNAAMAAHLATVHPRVCGELAVDSVALPSHTGSSPRVRGTRRRGARPNRGRRFIPACAGNSRPITTETASDDGSSPRVRGTP